MLAHLVYVELRCYDLIDIAAMRCISLKNMKAWKHICWVCLAKANVNFSDNTPCNFYAKPPISTLYALQPYHFQRILPVYCILPAPTVLQEQTSSKLVMKDMICPNDSGWLALLHVQGLHESPICHNPVTEHVQDSGGSDNVWYVLCFRISNGHPESRWSIDFYVLWSALKSFEHVNLSPGPCTNYYGPSFF